MTAFNKAWTLLKELSPSAQDMQDKARQFARQNKIKHRNRFYGSDELRRIQRMNRFPPPTEDYTVVDDTDFKDWTFY